MMATEDEVILEDDYDYLAVTAPGGLAQDGAVCAIEIGRGFMAPDDPEATILVLCAKGAANMIAALQAALDAAKENA